MNWIDFTIVALYLIGFLAMGYLFKENKDSKDYFLGGRSLGWFPLSLSTMATQLSAISFVSAPAFVGLKLNGGMKWLTFELGVPLAMIAIMIVIIPPLYRSGIVSIYEFVEKRFNYSTRLILSVVFQISRALGTGVMVYLIAIILQAVLDIHFAWTIIIISIITIIYSWQGGMKAVVWGDSIQMILLFAGLFICLIVGWNLVGEHGNVMESLNHTRIDPIDFNLGIGAGKEYGLVPMILGGFFLYVSYYGCDQTQAQRMLSAKDESTIRKLLMANGLLRFPVVFVYCFMGLVVGALVSLDSSFLQEIIETSHKHFNPDQLNEISTGQTLKADLMIPVFIMKYLPHGLIGILIVGIMSAAMSSLSSTVNSLSAVTVEDFFNRGKEKLSQKKYIRLSRLSVIFWGGVCLGAAFLFRGGGTVIEIINAIGSVFYGPVLATFVLAIFSKRITATGMNAGIIGAVVINIIINGTIPKMLGIDLGLSIFWIWLNFTGFALTVIIAYLVSAFTKGEVKEFKTEYSFTIKDFFRKEPLILFVFFVFILLICFSLPSILS